VAIAARPNFLNLRTNFYSMSVHLFCVCVAQLVVIRLTWSAASLA